MSSEPLDEVDRGILQLLQTDARNLTPVDMAEDLPVSEGTVRNRIDRLESRGIITGYIPTLDYAAAGYPLTIVFTCTAPHDQQDNLAEAALEMDRVVKVHELVAAQGNVEVTAVATDLEDIIATATALVELGLDIEMHRFLRQEYDQPAHQLGTDVTDD